MIAIMVKSSCFHTSQTPSMVEARLLTCKTVLNVTYSLFHTAFLFSTLGNNFNCTRPRPKYLIRCKEQLVLFLAIRRQAYVCQTYV